MIHVPPVAIQRAREEARKANLLSTAARRFLPLLRCPLCSNALQAADDYLTCSHGHLVHIVRGIPDFGDFVTTSLEEKLQQAAFHDDEEGNESFEEIVLRPYNYNRIHSTSWLYHLRHFRNVVESRLGIGLDGATVLNCGCGGGFEAQFLAECGATLVGFDISQLRAEAAATRFNLHGLSGMFYRGDAALLPFPDRSFDLVLYHDSLHHLPIGEIPLAMREAARVAAKGVVLLEAHDSPLRMLLETIGLSSSIERAGNYVFRFRKSLLRFWAPQLSLDLGPVNTSEALRR